MNDGQVVADSNVGCGRQQRGRWAAETGISRAAAERSVRDAIVEAPAGEELRVGKTEGLAFPKFAEGWNSLAIPGRVDLCFVDQRGFDEPGIRHLHAISGTQAVGGNRGQLRSDEGAVGINQIVIVMEVAAIHGVLFVEAVINARVILAPVEWIRLLEGGIVGSGRVCIRHRQLLHGAVKRTKRLSIRTENHRRPTQPQVSQVAAWDWLTGGNRSAGGRIDCGVPGRDVKRSGAGTEVSSPFRPGRQTPSHWSGILPDTLVFLAHKKEELVFLNRSVEVPAEIVEAQLGPY